MKGSRAVYRTIEVGAVLAFMPALIGGLWGWMGVHPPRVVPDRGEYPDYWGITFQDLILQTPDGLRLAAWYTPPVNGVVILVGHGYANARMGEIHALFARHGYGALSWDFRAHGVSEGTICSLGYYEQMDVEAALDYALAQAGVQRIGLWGGSMGGIAGLRAAEWRPEIEALVLDSVPSTLEETFEIVVRPAPLRPTFRWITEERVGQRMAVIRPEEQITRVTGRPMLAIQGGADDLIPPDSAERLCEAAGKGCAWWLVPEAGHVEAHRCRPADYEARVIRFFDDALLVASPGAAP